MTSQKNKGHNEGLETHDVSVLVQPFFAFDVTLVLVFLDFFRGGATWGAVRPFSSH